MRILHAVENYFPAKGGMEEVVRQLSERLAAAGHEVTVATRKHPGRDLKEKNGVKVVEFDVHGNYATGMRGEVDKYQRFLLEEKFDLVTFFAAQQFTTDAALDILGQIKAKKVSVPTGYSNFYNPAYQDYYQKMREWIKSYDMNVYLSNQYRDIDFARKNKVEKIKIIPNGADEREFAEKTEYIDIRKKFSLASDCFLVLHVGNYTGKKGHREAIEIFLRSKIKNGTLLMIGHNNAYFKKRSVFKYYKTGLLWLSKKFSSKKIILTEADRQTTVAAYKQTDVFLFPSNIECSPIVLFEAAAAGTPFLASDVGNSAEIAEWTGGGMILPTHKTSEGQSEVQIKGSVEMMNKIYSDKGLREKLGSEGHKNWQQKFTWQKIASQYEELYKNLK